MISLLWVPACFPYRVPVGMQYIAISAESVISLLEIIDFCTAAVILACGLMAIIVLQKAAKIQNGETILIESAAVGLGLFVV